MVYGRVRGDSGDTVWQGHQLRTHCQAGGKACVVLGDADDDDDWLTCWFDHSRMSKVAALITIMSLLRLTGDVKRQVGVCLKNLPSPSPSGDSSRTKPRFHSGNVPWQRVINAKGGISPRSAPSSWRQRLVGFEFAC